MAAATASRPRSSLPPAECSDTSPLAAVGFVLWIVYVITDNHPIGWGGVALLAPS